jgi:hypothetical protein
MIIGDAMNGQLSGVGVIEDAQIIVTKGKGNA